MMNHLKRKFFRRVIQIKATDSPNVRYALAQKKQGIEPTGEELVPGVLSWSQYLQRRATWDKVRACVGLDAEFYAGPEELMFPSDWLDKAGERAALLPRRTTAQAIGVDTAEGSDSTVWAIIDELGLIKLISIKTLDTSVITGRTIALMQEYKVEPECVMFDRGGGGRQHMDRLRSQGYNVNDTAFGESPTPDPVQYAKLFEQKLYDQHERYVYANRRAQMYHLLRLRLDPINNQQSFGIPVEYSELRRQLAPIPLTYDEEGRIKMLPKRPRPFSRQNDGTMVKSLEELIGRSPDDADALVLAVYAMQPEVGGVVITPMF